MVTGLDCYDKWGDPNTIWDEGQYMTIWEVPKYIWQLIPAIPRRIYCNNELIIPLETAFLNIINRELTDQVKTWDGCFHVRPIRGREKEVESLLRQGNIEKAMIYMSIHSWGIAFDINAAWNGLGKEPQMSNELVKCFTDAGFEWGGDWKRMDGMHFQLAFI
jgi:hypothetical protein